MTGHDVNAQDTPPVVTTHPLLGVASVLLGALIATCTGRLMSVGLADIRGALHLGVDEGSWINTTFKRLHDVYRALLRIPGKPPRSQASPFGLRMDLHRSKFPDPLVPVGGK